MLLMAFITAYCYFNALRCFGRLSVCMSCGVIVIVPHLGDMPVFHRMQALGLSNALQLQTLQDHVVESKALLALHGNPNDHAYLLYHMPR